MCDSHSAPHAVLGRPFAASCIRRWSWRRPGEATSFSRWYPLLRSILAIITIALLAALGIIAARWAMDHFVYAPIPVEIPPDAPIRHRGAEIIATRALESFHALPDAEREAISVNLRHNVEPLAAWLAHVDDSRYEFICLGEHHDESTRRFMAAELLPALPMDVLMLEATPAELDDITSRMQKNERDVPLLDADIAAVIRSARGRNPSLKLAAIEEQSAQRAWRQTVGRGTRDKSIAVNFRSNVRRGKRHVALLGALHCTNQDGWLYPRVSTGETRISPERMLNVNVLGNHQDGTLEALLVFMNELGIEHREFAIADTAALHPFIYEWFATLTRRFGYYRSVVVFDEPATPLAARDSLRH